MVELPAGFENVRLHGPLDDEIISILRELAGFIALISEPRQIQPSNEKESDSVISSLRSRLLSAGTSNTVNDASRLGSLICLETTLQRYPSERQQYDGILDKLKLHIQTLSSSSEPQRANEVVELVLWLAFQGGVISLDGPRKSWFLSFIWNTASRSNILCWRGVKVVLEKFLWVERIHEEPFSNLWEDAVMAGAVSTRGSLY